MARLILVNGPPGIGKSTLARRFADEHPPARCLDLDDLRATLDGWRDDQEASGRRARELGLTRAREHLTAGRDVVVPQLLARTRFIDALGALAAEVGATFHEIVLWDTQASSVARCMERSRLRRSLGQPDDAGEAIEAAGGRAALEAFHDQLEALVRARPQSVVIRSEAGRPDETYATLVVAISSSERHR